jgi:FUN14 domain-containing protein 1
MGSVMGYCSGYASKQFGKAVAFYVGCGFVIIQGLAYKGYIDVKWNSIKHDAIVLADADGDGKLTVKDMKMWWTKARRVLEYNLPSGGGFGLGFVMGLAA